MCSNREILTEALAADEQYYRDKWTLFGNEAEKMEIAVIKNQRLLRKRVDKLALRKQVRVQNLPQKWPRTPSLHSLLIFCLLSSSPGTEEGIRPHEVLGASESKSPRLPNPPEGPHRLGAHDSRTLLHCPGSPAPEGHVVSAGLARFFCPLPGSSHFDFKRRPPKFIARVTLGSSVVLN